MKSRVLNTFFASLFSLGLVASAGAELIPKLGGLVVYDTDRDITWLADANLAATNTFGVPDVNADGTMAVGLLTANRWLDAMNAANYLGFNDWRSPTTLQPDPSCDRQDAFGSTGLICSGSELGHLFYTEIGATARSSVVNTGDPVELAKFTNIQANTPAPGRPDYYIASKEYMWVESERQSVIYTYELGYGRQQANTVNDPFFVWPVRDGDVGPQLPSELIADLLDSVIALNIRQGIANALDSKLRNVLKLLDENNDDDNGENKSNANLPAVNMTYAFIYSVEAQRDKEITAPDADSLIKDANEIIDSLGGDGGRGKPIIVIGPQK